MRAEGRRTCPPPTSRWRTWLGVAALLTTAPGCVTSPDPSRVARRDVPRGAYVAVQLTDGRRVGGELLALHDSALVLLSANRVAVGRLADVTAVDWVEALLPVGFDPRGGLSPRRRRQAQLASRFPYGLGDSALATLLAGLGQAAPDTLRVAAR